LTHVRNLEAPLSRREIDRVGVEVAAAAADAGALLGGFELLRPLGHAWAARVRVDEPHAFLRHRLEGFLRAVKPWQERCGHQVYLEVLDGEDMPVLVNALYAGGGATQIRRDVMCCDRSIRLGRGLSEPPPPRCPVFVEIDAASSRARRPGSRTRAVLGVVGTLGRSGRRGGGGLDR
jgi:hypothetical protein